MTAGADPSPPSWPMLLERGVALHRAGDLSAARQLYRRVLELLPAQADAINLLGIIGLQTGDIESAVSLGRQACRLDPAQPSYHLSLGNALRASGQFAAAAEEFTIAVALNPDYAEAHNNLGLALADLNQQEAAIAAFKRAVTLQPTAARSWNNLAAALRRAGRPADAAGACRKAIAADASFAPAHNTLGNALLDLDDPPAAIAAFGEASRLDPRYADALANLCLAEYRAGHFAESAAAGRAAVKLAPDSAAAHWNLAHALLILGDFAGGWAEYEWRIHCPPPTCPPAPPRGIERWVGQSLAGKTILLQSEQGYGDTIQFIRYAKPLASLGATVLLQCPAPLAPLLKGAAGIADLAGADPQADFVCPLMSLPHRVGSIPADVPYLTADANRLLVAKNGNELHIGLAWAGRRSYANDRHRSLPTSALAPLGAIPRIHLHSLQRDDSPPPGLSIHDHADQLKDFADTAALISQLDLVISVDTAVAHLAGALAKPTFLLLPHIPDCRWQFDREDTPWYPTMRLFRQPGPGEWATVVEEVARIVTYKCSPTM